MNDLIARAAREVADTRRVVALTGAGISIESGIPPFRGPGGLWEKIDPLEVAHIDAFRRNPRKVWELLIQGMQKVLVRAAPNPAHRGLASLEAAGHLQAVITQNVDGLHQQAGSRDVIEFHGTFAWQRCMDCERRLRSDALDLAEIPPRCACGGILRPDCVFFGELIPPEHLARAQQLAAGIEHSILLSDLQVHHILRIRRIGTIVTAPRPVFDQAAAKHHQSSMGCNR